MKFPFIIWLGTFIQILFKNMHANMQEKNGKYAKNYTNIFYINLQKTIKITTWKNKILSIIL